jgi:hypothetical protein
MKGQINIVELIFVLVALLIAFGVLFPGFVYENKWKDANILINSRDLILTIDRTGNLYNYSFDKKSLSLFLDKVSAENKTNLVAWSEIEGTVQDRFIVACNCTREQIEAMSSWYDGLKINGRNVKLLFVQSSLGNIPEETDVLLIRGYTPLDSYLPNFQNYVSKGIGIVEMMDFMGSLDLVNNDRVQTQIFGLNWVDVKKRQSDNMDFSSQPKNSSDTIYYPYKYFYHLPFPLKTYSSKSIVGCQYQPSGLGNLSLGSVNYSFWICSPTSVRFDTDGNGVEDTSVSLGDNVTIGGYNFVLSYIDDNNAISLSFRPKYTFSDFLTYIFPPGTPDPQGWGYGTKRIDVINPIDGNMEKVLIKSVSTSPPGEYPAVILNTVSISRVAWIPDFTASTRDKNTQSDDSKNLLLSLLFWASKKRATPVLYQPIKTGYLSSYINVKNTDMFEVYKFSLGLAYPY